MVEITDAFTTAENVSFILDTCQSIFFNFLIYSVFHPSSDFLTCQILPEEAPMQEQEPDSHLMILLVSKVILLPSTLRLLIPQLGIQLMVGKLYVPLFFCNNYELKISLILHIPMLKAQSRFNQMLLVHHQLFLLFRQKLLQKRYCIFFIIHFVIN